MKSSISIDIEVDEHLDRASTEAMEEELFGRMNSLYPDGKPEFDNILDRADMLNEIPLRIYSLFTGDLPKSQKLNLVKIMVQRLRR